MQEEKKQLQGFPLTIELYAYDAQEVDAARKALVAFIAAHAKQGRAVTATKVAQAVENWDKNPLVKNQIINYFK